MATGLRKVLVASCLGLGLLGGRAWAAETLAPATAPGREIPAPFAPFEYLIGSWKGSGVPTANRVKGWVESHAWAWKFDKGIPVGMSVEATGDKILAKAQLTYDAASKTYTLAGTDPAGKPITFVGGFDKTGRLLTLDRVGTTADGAKQKAILTPNANFVRYTMRFMDQEAGSPQFKPVIDVGLTKEGESFAAGGSAADLPKCIVTGGAATMSVSYQGRSFPLCCSGCKDEFNDNPEKYIKKLALKNEAGGGKTGAKSASSSVGKDDGTFGDVMVDEPKAATKKSTATAKSKAAAPAKDAAADAAKVDEPTKTPDNSAKAASTLKLGQNLDKAGKTAAALMYYRQVVKLYPDTPAAKTAADRIKALGVR